MEGDGRGREADRGRMGLASRFILSIHPYLLSAARSDVTDSFEPLSEFDIVPVGQLDIRVFGSILLR